MKKYFFLLILFLLACSKKEPTLIGKTYQTNFKKLSITLTFHNGGHFSGTSLNQYFGTYKINQNQIQLILKGSTTKIGISSQLENENTYFQSLKTLNSFTWDQENLILSGEEIKYTFRPLNSD